LEWFIPNNLTFYAFLNKERVFKERVIKTTITKGFLFRINTNGASPEF